MNGLEGKVALITGAARGQGRSHAVTLAEHGVDIIAIDICEQMSIAPYPMGTEEELQETVAQVEQADRRIVAKKADIRDREALGAAISEGVSELGRLDIVAANAAVASLSPALELTDSAWRDVIDVNLTGTWNTAVEAAPHILEGGRGGSMILTSSAAGLKAVPNLCHYAAAKFGIIGVMRTLAIELAAESVRVNALCPTSVDTKMMVNDAHLKVFMPHLEAPTRADAEAPDSAFNMMNAMPVPWLDPREVSNALLFLASDEARFITGVALPVDAGFLLK